MSGGKRREAPEEAPKKEERKRDREDPERERKKKGRMFIMLTRQKINIRGQQGQEGLKKKLCVHIAHAPSPSIHTGTLCLRVCRCV